MRQIIINVEPYEKRVAITRKGDLEEFQVERKDEPRLAGNIYKGIIESVVPGIGALFVNIKAEKNGFLYIHDIEEKAYKALLDEEIDLEKKVPRKGKPHEGFKKGQEILVQTVKEPIGTKGALLTTNISLPGKNLVLTPFNGTIGISKRIADRRQRAELRNLLEGFRLPKGMGCIARTESMKATPRQLKLELKYLLNLWWRVQRRAEKEKAPSPVYEEYDLPLRIIRDYLSQDIEKILVDSKDEYKKICRFTAVVQPMLRRKIFYYRGKAPIFEHYGIEEKIERVFRRKVFLKSGGYIIIEQTESLIAIDVNTGKFTGKKRPEETTFKTNMEAALEIAKQVMLRDIGGIIVIDFIDMSEKRHKKDVYRELETAFSRDKAKINILTISPIGLIEMTRQRVRKSLESVSFKECPYCGGMGKVKTPATIAIDTVRKLKRHLAERRLRSREIVVTMHHDTAEYMKSTFQDVIHSLERRFRKKIVIRSDTKLHMEDVYVE